MLYLIIAVAIFITFLFFIKGLSSVRPEKVKIAYKYTMVILAILLILLLIRFGQPIIAAVIGFSVAVFPYLKNIPKIFFGWKVLRQLFGEVKKSKSTRKAPPAKMTIKQAREVLGVSDKATKKEIDEAYKRLMKKNHPDAGGSKYLAEQLNQAREVLRSSTKID